MPRGQFVVPCYRCFFYCLYSQARHVCILAFLALSARGSVRNHPESVEEKFHLARHLTIGKTLLPDKNPEKKTKQNNKQKEKGDGTSTVSL